MILQSLTRVSMQTTDWASSHLSLHTTRKSLGFACCVGEVHILSGLNVCQSRVYSQDDTFSSVVSYIVADVGKGTESYMSSESSSLLVSPRRQDVEAEEVVSVWLIYCFSHTFSLDHQFTRTQSPGEVFTQNNLRYFAKTSTFSYSKMRCLRVNTVQYVREMEDEDEVVGGWVGGVTRHWLVHPA